MDFEDFKDDPLLGHAMLALSLRCFNSNSETLKEAFKKELPNFNEDLLKEYSSSEFLESLVKKMNESVNMVTTVVSADSVGPPEPEKRKEVKEEEPQVDFSSFF